MAHRIVNNQDATEEENLLEFQRNQADELANSYDERQLFFFRQQKVCAQVCSTTTRVSVSARHDPSRLLHLQQMPHQGALYLPLPARKGRSAGSSRSV